MGGRDGDSFSAFHVLNALLNFSSTCWWGARGIGEEGGVVTSPPLRAIEPILCALEKSAQATFPR